MSKRSRHVAAGLSLLAALLLVPSLGLAQIATDRPDFVESSLTVGRRALQIETSIAVDDVGWSMPTLVRVGIGATLEFRFEAAAVSGLRPDPGGEGTQTLAGAEIGLKWHAWNQAHALPSTAVLIHARSPVRSPGPDPDGIGPSLRVVGEWELPGGFALGLMPGLALPLENGSRNVRGIMGLVLGKEITSTLRTFGEVAVEGRDGTLNTGVALLVTQQTQIDIGFSLRALGEASDMALGFGLSHLMGW